MPWQLDKKYPICPQLCEQLCARIAAGEFLPKQRLMSVRELATTVGVNPNTVQHSFSMLEQKGILYSERGSGWYVADNPQAIREVYQALVRKKVNAFFKNMAEIGVSEAEVKKLVKEWEK